MSNSERIKKRVENAIAIFVLLALVTATVFFNIPRYLNGALGFDESEDLWVTVFVTSQTRAGVVTAENLTFERGTTEFEAINELLREHTFRRRISNNERVYAEDGGLVTITISGRGVNGNYDNYLVVDSGGILINGALRRVSNESLIELINGIMEIAGGF